ncbi:hypothetical protein A2715_01790 [Candidatus Woesebacteria bacterium RIFCSPHIGHO2_01_FULL_39_32]|uniref:Uncharacterized protein n=2 Tax=Candidatus Woeseibacteriota TaxID=1752722 RepID=A0A0G0PV72_9BACT|nr:MAG: hypothetical protein UT61_C0037G0004 [Candidatus Woesebacteria bacterium GW2011_GWA1_39_8]OGM04537.1 MAG: hypothetical protein A2124_00935 [Candidatus Woesebacteria bacterium GWB1_37_5]OGM23890.1 MAG: hypothetical protein A2715_01790 [Candidatus Woesebacteria bacterium RIFCSPHIGHO2_01_FULL_39_32]OGM38645.1 MAG: hypothetical protein A3F01_02735 [Candidatus Woesebacteria bacterium RIFCSPHIGHO2_12_FULL_38_11]OGM64079.1 MAG: hypothetical protein A2893_03030 [Candidatus Woesebacteria bacteri
MSKRRRFILTSILLSLGFIAVQVFPQQYRFLSIGSLGVLTLILFSWSLREGLSYNMTLLALILPILFTVAVGLFWFLLPSSIFARIPVVALYGFGVYALCLTVNIYTVAAVRTIALMRAARGVGFVLTLLTFFLIFDTILSLKWPLYFLVPLITFCSFPLFFQGFWTISLDTQFSKKMMSMSVITSLVIGEIAFALFFWPASIVVGSLFLTVSTYVLLGLGQAYLEERLFSQTVREYLVIGAAVFIGMFLVTRWGG